MDRLLRRSEVQRITALAKSTIYLKISEGTFPAPIRIGRRAVRWKLSSIVAWIDECIDGLCRYYYNPRMNT